jgi:hypothetical protein
LGVTGPVDLAAANAAYCSSWHQQWDQSLQWQGSQRFAQTMGDGTRKYWVPKYKKERYIPVPKSLFDKLNAGPMNRPW